MTIAIPVSTGGEGACLCHQAALPHYSTYMTITDKQGIFKVRYSQSSPPREKQAAWTRSKIRMAETRLNNPPSFLAFLDQHRSPLFSVLPAEIRSEIFAYALTDDEDTSNLYSKETCYRRPGYNAPRRTYIELLRTCKRIFNETWFMPFAYAEHSLYLVNPERAPVRYITTDKLQHYLDLLYASQGDNIKIDHVRIFAQLWKLEPGDSLQEILGMRYFYPKTMTVTIRYTDFWYWEDNIPLRVNSKWVQRCRFPNTLTRLRIDFESVERRKNEIDYIAREAAANWHFKRQDNMILRGHYPEKTPTMRWTGNSTWLGRRWIRDEVRANELDYYVVTVVWKPSGEFLEADLECPQLRVPRNFPRPSVLQNRNPFLDVEALQAANVGPDATADEALAAVQAYYSRLHFNR